MFEILCCDSLSTVYLEQVFCNNVREQGGQGRHKPQNDATNGELVVWWSEKAHNAFNSMMNMEFDDLILHMSVWAVANKLKN